MTLLVAEEVRDMTMDQSLEKKQTVYPNNRMCIFRFVLLFHIFHQFIVY